MKVTIHLDREANIPPAELFPETPSHRRFVSIELPNGCILCSVEQARSIAEEILRALEPETIYGPVASALTTAAALEASRQ